MNMELARRQMVEQQVRAWDVDDPAVLDVMKRIAREAFLPVQFRDIAYADGEILLGHGQYLMPPVVEGRLLQALDLQSGESVLEIGTGSGYLTACLAELAGRITSIDIFSDFTDSAASALETAGIENVTLQTMDAVQELPDSQFDAIVVTGSIPHPEPRFLDCLKPDGRMFVIVGRAPIMVAQLVRKGDNAAWSAENLFETSVRQLVNWPEENKFIF